MFTVYIRSNEVLKIRKRKNLYVESSNMRSIYHLEVMCSQDCYKRNNRAIDICRSTYSIIKLWFKLYLELINFNNAIWVTKYTDKIVIIIQKIWFYKEDYLCEKQIIGNFEAYIHSLKWLIQGDKAHFKCIFIYNESTLLCWLWFVLLYQIQCLKVVII